MEDFSAFGGFGDFGDFGAFGDFDDFDARNLFIFDDLRDLCDFGGEYNGISLSDDFDEGVDVSNEADTLNESFINEKFDELFPFNDGTKFDFALAIFGNFFDFNDFDFDPFDFGAILDAQFFIDDDQLFLLFLFFLLYLLYLLGLFGSLSSFDRGLFDNNHF